MKKSCNICRSKGKLTILSDDELIINQKGEYVCSECIKEEAKEHKKSED